MDPVEPGLVTLAKIIGLLIVSIGIVPLVFLMMPGDKTEPKDHFDPEH